jgi:hypothetical protein
LLLSLLRLTRWPGRPAAVLLLALFYTWAFVALDITHTHAANVAQAVPGSHRLLSVKPAGGHVLTPWAAGAPETPCPVCAAVHAASATLVRPLAPVHPLAPDQLFVARTPSFAPTHSLSTLHLRGPPQA